INDGVRKPNVVGGEEVKPAFKYPWIVSLQWKGSHVCGGTMIKNNLVLTAAHCSTGNQNDFSVAIHRHNLSKTMKEEKSQSFKILKRYVHENYNTITNFNDAAIWKLSGKYEGDFEPILFDNGEGSIAGDSVFGIGWGRLKVDGPLSNVLMEVEMPVTEPKKCIDIMKEQGYTISSDIQVCAGLPEGGKDTCQGDSGGPLISKKGGKMILVGITSFGISCALPNLPGIYTKVKGIVPWIEGKIKEAES
ncbi:trypsin-like serine protease, partial [Neoconidiobolus thromboides FSU 785]